MRKADVEVINQSKDTKTFFSQALNNTLLQL